MFGVCLFGIHSSISIHVRLFYCTNNIDIPAQKKKYIRRCTRVQEKTSIEHLVVLIIMVYTVEHHWMPSNNKNKLNFTSVWINYLDMKCVRLANQSIRFIIGNTQKKGDTTTKEAPFECRCLKQCCQRFIKYF